MATITRSALVGSLDGRLEAVLDRYTLAQYLTVLPELERSILHLRFIGDLTQQEIGEQLGTSQMHVSRPLTHSLQALRAMILGQQ